VRLKIIDLAGGDQPLLNGDGDTVVVFNGEIYNHRELRDGA
jgi:asparagine synthase (glutamine-hydrolysing)